MMWTPLHSAVENNDYNTAVKFIATGANMDVGGKYGYPIESKYFTGQEMLNAPDIQGGPTPLILAVGNNNYKMVAMLIKNGAVVECEIGFGVTPLNEAARNNAHKIAGLLLENGARANSTSVYDTALHHAGGYEVATLLIKNGADVNASNEFGSTPLHMQAITDNYKVAALLIKNGADVNATTRRGGTPLHYSVWGTGSTGKVTELLIKNGAYVNATDEDWKTPLDLAKEKKNWNAVRILESVQRKSLPADENSAEKVFNKTWRSVVVIENGNWQGSGVIVDRNVVATNCHVVDNFGHILVYKSTKRNAKSDFGFLATIRFADSRNDFCLLNVRGLQGRPVTTRPYKTLKVGEKIYVLGAPKGLNLSISEGLISQLRRTNGNSLIQTDAAISPGSSGGGLFDGDGNLIGLMTWKFADKAVEGIGFAISADLVVNLLDR